MKRLIKIFSLLVMASLVLAACEKEENRVLFSGGTAPVLSANKTEIQLSENQKDAEALRLNWTNPDYQFNTGVSSQSVTYLLQMDVAGQNFANPFVVSLGNELGKTFTAEELNNILVSSLKLPTEAESSFDIRLLASLNNLPATQLVSNVMTLKATPYKTVLPTFSLHIPGGYQGWAPDKAPSLVSYDTKTFDAYFSMPEASEFKFTSEPNWNGTNYGAGAAAGELSTDGGAGNLKIETPGYYRAVVDLNKLTYKFTLANWGIIGAATPGSWDKSTPFTVDPETGKLVIERISLKADEFKFRANDAWDLNLGNDAATGLLKYGGDNLKVNEAGDYKVILDLTQPDYTYELIKL